MTSFSFDFDLNKLSLWSFMAAAAQTATCTDMVIAQRRESFEPATKQPMTNIFAELGYRGPEERAAFVQLLGISGVLPDGVDAPKDRLMTDEEALRALEQMRFPSERAAFEWLLASTQATWIRKTQTQEGKTAAAGVNVARWFVQDEGLIAKNKEELQKVVRRLGFFDGSSWTKTQFPDEILLMGGLEQQIVERLSGLQQLPIEGPTRLCYLTGNRGVFNFEPSLAPMLAEEWFGDASLTPTIKKVLSSTDKDWRAGRTMQLQLLILAAIGKIDPEEVKKIVTELDEGRDKSKAIEILKQLWPQRKGFYWQAPEKYGEQTAGWPVAADLVAYHVKQLKKSEPGRFDNLEIVPIVASGKGGRLANTADTVEQWVKERGAGLLQALGRQPLLASLSSQPHTLYMHETTLKELPPNYRVVTVSGPSGDSKTPIVTVLDVAARFIYTLKEEMRTKWKEPQS